MKFEILHTPGETPDALSVWIPKYRAVFVGDLMYDSFPNIYTLRGTPPRWALDYVHSLNRVLARKPQTITYDVQGEVYDIEDKIALLQRVVAEGAVRFAELMSRCRDRGEIIVTFMALLELIKLGGVTVVQSEVFGEISIVAREPGGNDPDATAPTASGA